MRLRRDGILGMAEPAQGRLSSDAIEDRLGAILGSKTRIHGSGRTDAGVHAYGQVFHFTPNGGTGLRSLRRR